MCHDPSAVLRSFNTAGPCEPSRDYMLPPTARLPEVRELVDRSKYFVVHAPRQVGKTTALLAFARELLAEGTYAAVLLTMESGAAFRDDIGAAEIAILHNWRSGIDSQLPPELRPPPFPDAPPGARMGAALETWAVWSRRPLVVFLDEVDALRDGVLISVLHQLRSGYRRRPKSFPWSLALIGLRDLRDYRVASDNRDHLDPVSMFNVKARSLTLRNFTRDEVAQLYHQHTRETGQAFTNEAVLRAFELTQGRPWRVNALAAVATNEFVKDRTICVTPAHIERADAILIERHERPSPERA